MRSFCIAVLLVALAAHDARAGTIRVLLARHVAQAAVASETGLIVRNADDPAGPPLVAPELTMALDLRAQPTGLVLAGAIGAPPRLTISPLGAGPLFVNGHAFRGRLTVWRAVDGAGNPAVDVVNDVDLEEYLYGVVGAEVGNAFPPAALAAQAIAARSYAMSRMHGHDADGYDVVAGEQDQAYRGMEAEFQAAADAVDVTRGVVLVFAHQVVHAYYSACSGGFTSDGRTLSDPQPYLAATPDPYGAGGPEARWTATFSLDAVRQALAPAFGDVGRIVSIAKGDADDSGRLESVVIATADGQRIVPATQFRRLLGTHALRSTRIATIATAGDWVTISGAGFGHGVGMSQCSARQMALAGLGIQDILHYYYHGATLARLAR